MRLPIHGEGKYVRWVRSRFGANDHYIDFPTGTEKFELRTLGSAQW